jgi:hypothetical protein
MKTVLSTSLRATALLAAALLILPSCQAKSAEATQASAQSVGKLPFVGKRYFNFLGGSGTNESITISANGNTLIESHGTASSSVLYQGAYQPDMPISYDGGVSGYYRIVGNTVHSLDIDKAPAMDCRDEGEPCTAELFE